jgi:hypothetical protein
MMILTKRKNTTVDVIRVQQFLANDVTALTKDNDEHTTDRFKMNR